MRYAVAALIVGLVVGAGAVEAQETTGDIIGAVTSQDGAPLPGVTVTVVDPARGFKRSTSCGPRGTYKLVSLQPAGYQLTANLDGFKTVQRQLRVELGGTATADIQMEVGEFTDTIEVTGAVPLVDTRSTVSGITTNTDELNAQLPISRDVTRVAMLAPGTLPASRDFPGASAILGWYMQTPGQDVPVIAGASLAENSYIVNGLNTTSFSRMIGSSYVPMEFVDEVQVKTGGYEAEFGRSTGGVINLVTKSGTNTFRGGASVYWNPQNLQENENDTYQRDDEGSLSILNYNSYEWRRSLEANMSLGGPIVRDRLFAFGFFRYSDWERIDKWDWGGVPWATLVGSSQAYWGGKLDWNITSAHLLEGTFLSDAVRVDGSDHFFDPANGDLDDPFSDGYSDRGGENWALKYTGLLSPRVVISAQAGVNPFDRTDRYTNDDVCPYAYDDRSGETRYIGCWIGALPGAHSDERVAYRADLDWFVGRHGLRAGVDAETNTTDEDTTYSGGVYYRYYLNGTEGEPPDTYRFPDLPWDQELVRVRHYSRGGSFDILSNAAYVQDGWSVTPNVTLNFGLRWERFEVGNPLGETFMEIDDQLAPRVGAIWDVAGDGRSKLYGSFGIYHLPMSSTPAPDLAAGAYFDEAWHILVGGIEADGSPEDVGEMLDYILYDDGEIPDTRERVDSDLEPMSQSELILGYERLVGETWTVGVRGVARRFNEVIEDITLDKALYEVYGVESCYAQGCWQNVLTNPGTDYSGWYDLDGDGEFDPIFLTAEELGYPDAERTYVAVELTARRRFANRWMLQGSYTWSHLYGNYSGLANSDLGQDVPYFTSIFDVAGRAEHGSGDLPNDRRHNLKLFGMYSVNFGLQISGNVWFRSGRPINGFGVHPNDPWARSYRGARPYAFYNHGVPCPRGCGGRTESVWGLDLGLKYDWQWVGIDWNVRVDAFNATNNQSVELIEEFAEEYDAQPNPSYLLPRAYQVPRSVRFGFGVSF